MRQRDSKKLCESETDIQRERDERLKQKDSDRKTDEQRDRRDKNRQGDIETDKWTERMTDSEMDSLKDIQTAGWKPTHLTSANICI